MSHLLPSIQALIHGLNRHYYSIVIDYRKNELEEQMLMNLHKRNWTSGLSLEKFEDHQQSNEDVVDKMLKLTTDYNDRVKAEEGKRSGVSFNNNNLKQLILHAMIK